MAFLLSYFLNHLFRKSLVLFLSDCLILQHRKSPEQLDCLISFFVWCLSVMIKVLVTGGVLDTSQMSLEVMFIVI